MLITCFTILSVTVLLGASLLIRRPRGLAFLHGLSGAAGLGTLGMAMCAIRLQGAIALDCLFLLAGGLCGGLILAGFSWRGRRRSGLVVLLHATAGGLAYLLVFGLAFGR